jgi:predicted phage tail protein
MKSHKNKKNIPSENIVGAGGGGKGGGSSGANIAPDNLSSVSSARVLFAVGEGEMGGLWTGDAKSIRINNTQLQNPSGTYNFNNVIWNVNTGTPSQTYIPGFSAAENYFSIGTEVFSYSPVTVTTSGPNIDAMRMDIQIPALSIQSSSTGDVKGSSVSFYFQTKLSTGGTWTTVKNVTETGKCSSPQIISYRIPRPTSAGIWQVKVVRTSPDDSGTLIQDRTIVNGYTEIQDVQLAYANTCVLGVQVDAKSIGTSVPTFSADWYGRKVRIPNNYDPVTRIYTGSWTGTFSATKYYTNNPAWIVFDMLTEARAGLGLADSQIDKFSFYNAAVYCDAGIQYTSGGVYVTGGVSDGAGGNEPRYTFNGVINQRLGSWDALQQVASIMHGRLFTTGQLIKLVIDQPGSPVALITNSNVINDGNTDFTYSTPSATTRFNACRVTFNDPAYNYQVKDILYNDTSTGEAYLQTDINGFGITSEGQARRLSKWVVDTSLYSTLTVAFKVSFEHAALEPFDIIKLMDTNVAGVNQETRIVSISGTSVTFDRPITVGTGTWTVDAVGSDGITIETRTITSTGTTSATHTVSSALTGAKNSAAIITGAVGAQYFRILSIKESKPFEYDVTATQYDSAKFARIEGGIAVATSPFFSNPNQTSVSPVSGFSYAQVSALQPDGSVGRYLDVEWAPVSTDYVVRYGVNWNKDDNPVTDLGSNILQPRVRIPLSTDGTYKINVIAYNSFGKASAQATGTYTATLSAPSGISPLPNVTSLQTVAGSTTVWTGPDLTVSWVAGVNTTASTLKDYQVTLVNSGTSSLFKTFYTTSTNFAYKFADNASDNGGTPVRNIAVTVKERDAGNLLTAGTAVTLINSAPAVPTSITATGMQNGVAVSWAATASTNTIAGYIVWASQTNAFTPSSANVVYQGSATAFIHANLATSAVWYYKVAAYDIFGVNLSGTGLNVSSQYTATATAAVGILGVTSLPGSGTEGQVVFNTTDGQLYRYHSGAWTVGVPAVNVGAGLLGTQIAAGTILGNNIAGNTITAGNLVANTITAGQIAANTITSSQIAANTITTNQIAANTIVGANIAGGTITGSLIAANTITAANLSVGSLSAITATLGSVTAGSISGSSIYGGSYGNAYAWPSSGGGFYLGPSGLLLGNASSGPGYFQLTASGDLYAPGISIVSGTLTISQANVINTLQIAGNAVQIPVYASASGATSVTITLPYTASVLITAVCTMGNPSGSGQTLSFHIHSTAGDSNYFSTSAAGGYGIAMTGTHFYSNLAAGTYTFSVVSTYGTVSFSSLTAQGVMR